MIDVSFMESQGGRRRAMNLHELMQRPQFFLPASRWMTDEDNPILAGPDVCETEEAGNG